MSECVVHRSLNNKFISQTMNFCKIFPVVKIIFPLPYYAFLINIKCKPYVSFDNRRKN